HVHHDVAPGHREWRDHDRPPRARVGSHATRLHAWRRGPVPFADRLPERIHELRCIGRSVPHAHPEQPEATASAYHAVSIAIPTSRGADGCRVILEVLKEEEPSTELAHRFVVRRRVSGSSECHIRRLVTRRAEICALAEYL